MTELTKEQVFDRLRQVALPDGKRDPVTAGILSDVLIRNGHVSFAIEIEPAQAETMETVRKACEAAIKELPQVRSCSAVLTADRSALGDIYVELGPDSLETAGEPS